tara:strand:+ start:58 stop:165 length:108 start_codon:yes stop_codon:yes gene_type:complete
MIEMLAVEVLTIEVQAKGLVDSFAQGLNALLKIHR